jgi:hypothetical protein
MPLYLILPYTREGVEDDSQPSTRNMANREAKRRIRTLIAIRGLVPEGKDEELK